MGGKDLKLVAVAGSGKTTTLRLMAEADPKRRLLYLAFNRGIRQDAQKAMPRNVRVKTLHGLAFGEMVQSDPLYREKFALSEGQVRAYHIREALDLGVVEAYVVKATLDNFLRSNLARPHPSMIPPRYRQFLQVRGQEAYERTMRSILEATQTLWQRMRDPQDPFPLSHDGYVKLWATNGASFPPVDALLVDEAQDLSPVFVNVLEGLGVQRVYVGDPAQQIYAWRGAVNAMATLGGEERRLSWSFRFGPELAAVVRGFMAQVGRDLVLEGKAAWPTRVGLLDLAALEFPVAVLCRTNAGVVQAALDLNLGSFHIQGGVEEVADLLEDAEALRRGGPRPKPHPDLVLLETWSHLELLAEEVKDPTAGVLVRLAQRHKDLGALAAFLRSSHVPREGEAPVVLSTAHKAKGREWRRVVLWEDFPPVWRLQEREGYRQRGLDLQEEENLLYVAMTRAMQELYLHPYLEDLLLGVGDELPREAPVGEGEGTSLGLLARLLLFLERVGEREDVPQDLREEAQALGREALGRLG